MLDKDLAQLYGVETKRLLRQVKRNAERFPDDFMYQLTRQEVVNLRCQFGTSSWGADHDEKIQKIFEAIRQLMLPPEEPKRRIGFQT